MDATAYFERMLLERGIPREWVDRVLEALKRVVDQSDGTRHYLAIICEFGGRG